MSVISSCFLPLTEPRFRIQGVYSLLTVRLGNTINSGPLRVLGTIFTLIIFVLYAGIASRTLVMLYDELAEMIPPDWEDEHFLLGITKAARRREENRSPENGLALEGDPYGTMT